MRLAFFVFAISISLGAYGAPLPRAFGHFQLGMTQAQVSAATGADFDSWCASCPSDGDQASLDASNFGPFSDAFPGLTPTNQMPNDAIVLLTTKGKLSGIVLLPEEKGPQLLSILRKRLGEPQKLGSDGTAEWNDAKTKIECDINSVRIYDRGAFPKR